jgi:hypothetical protein
VEALETSPKAFARWLQKPNGIKEFLKALAPENKTLAVIRTVARKERKSNISRRESTAKSSSRRERSL